MLYPAFVEIDQDGSVSGWFPDVAGCIFAGDTLEEAHSDAQSAINAHFELMKEQNLEFPFPKAMQQHLAEKADEYKNGQWLLIPVDMSQFEDKIERINITLPLRLINRIDAKVKQHPEYGSRSGFLALAARKALQ
ncbi:type II toxin-antitoxin system HicB family antitoxin [Xenorhabdus griffiniae]|uniref:Type II toxin-antitoxin system HicB family antitoxin n=1 Tax=Xenorhabdus griffiniae TaxID=351672 RepID=A0ABY9XFZ4_9GAMM|nr:type II toxin-antitoxin system HicB family antitoxin [Xenorhabdus griffiniae]MBD1226939.1 type II toxin-antitoxin system HicB family antitoxin [Xenorhabdus griffiniae]MBE8586306.1 type II toxin-antitoxin system HicB family antitoxin [Xenorhabdus griffiniae]WMV71831.1 type II toxin-antitoxin system HicB family antitoxin [Xenorhabdus griffiniae]WNH01508.1 type II toxin-antitoxin system HicB family antitoxin [Xenorhabdus griffiniae]